MIELIKKLLNKYSELIKYLIFGVLTTLVNFIVFVICNMLIGDKFYLLSNFIAWCVAVVFAFITNKIIVFNSKSMDKKLLIFELIAFTSARLFSLIIEQTGMFVFIDLLDFKSKSYDVLNIFVLSGQNLIKIIMSVITIVLNYIFSKLLVFKNKK